MSALRSTAGLRTAFLLPAIVVFVGGPTVLTAQAQDSKLAGFYRRAGHGLGYFLTRADIEARPAARTPDLLRRVPGLDVGQRGWRGVTPVTTDRREGCVPRFYVDGSFVPYLRVDNLDPDEIAGIEAYVGTSRVPTRFKKGDRCGVIAIWTRDPGEAAEPR